MGKRIRMNRLSFIYLLSLAFFILGFCLNILISTPYLSADQIFRLLTHPQAGRESMILWHLRLPRALVGIMVGANLSVSGALLQGVLRNPLAGPSVIGISSGAGFFAMLILIVFPHHFLLAPLGAFLGGCIAAILVYLLAWKNGVKPIRMILAGVAVSSLFSSGSSVLMVFYSDRVQGVIGWLVGGLNGVTWKDVKTLWIYSLLGILLALFFASQLNLMMLGDDMARNLGVSIEKMRIILTLLAVLLASSSVSVVGLISFVGLIVPNLVRMLIGSSYKHILSLSVLVGGGLITFSDAFAKTIFSPVEIPVGIFTALLGAPFFLAILRGRD